MIRSAPLNLMLAAVLTSAAATAETVYRWVDKDGSVNFSSETPPGTPASRVSTLEVAPGPPPEDQQAAEERAQRTQDAADRLREERQAVKQSRQQAVALAEDEVRRAQAQLAKAQIQNPDDWQTIAGVGGRHLKPGYFDRVRAAQEALAKAQDKLARTQRDAR